MNSQRALKSRRSEGGYVLIAAMTLVAVLLGTGLAFMRWATDETHQSAHASAAMQAYYLGQMGVIEKGFMWLRQRQASDLPVAEVVLSGENVGEHGKYENVRIYPVQPAGGDFFTQNRKYRISAVGVVTSPFYQGDRDDALGDFQEVKRTAVLYVDLRNFADYMYLSDEERTNFGDRIKFWSGDTLQGRVHSNSEIAIMTSPVFFDVVSTTEDDFWRGSGYNPIFLGPDPIFNAPPVLIPEVAENLRANAIHFDYGPSKQMRAHFTGGSVTLYNWNWGEAFDSTEAQSTVVPISGNTCIFCHHPLELLGVVTGTVTIGASASIRLIDDIKYSDADNQGRVSDASTNYLGIVSEGDVKVANTWVNGRENGFATGNPNRRNIVISGAIVALGESFTFEQQNDPDSGYVCDCIPDDRGTIYLFGSLTQARRGYVHRSTNQSTGYLKQYRYDLRFLRQRPPCFFDAVDESGRALFNIVQWGHDGEVPEVPRENVIRYN